MRVTAFPYVGKLSLKADELQDGMNIWKGNGNTTTLLFSLKVFEILLQKRRAQVNIIVMKHFNGIFFHKSGPANKQHTNQTTPTGKIHLGRPRRRWEDNIRMDLKEIGINTRN